MTVRFRNEDGTAIIEEAGRTIYTASDRRTVNDTKRFPYATLHRKKNIPRPVEYATTERVLSSRGYGTPPEKRDPIRTGIGIIRHAENYDINLDDTHRNKIEELLKLEDVRNTLNINHIPTTSHLREDIRHLFECTREEFDSKITVKPYHKSWTPLELPGLFEDENGKYMATLPVIVPDVRNMVKIDIDESWGDGPYEHRTLNAHQNWHIWLLDNGLENKR